jgi:histidine triad (HIT) family protein
MDGCIFCAIVAGREPASRVYEDADTLAFMNLRQANPGHVLVIPKGHVSTIDQLPLTLAATLAQTVVRVSRAIQAAFAPDGLSVWQSNGVAAGQEIFHVHVHVFSRRAGDGFLAVYPALPPVIPRPELDQLAAQLRATFSPTPI